METWWLKLKWQQLKTMLGVMRLVPDLSLRVAVTVTSLCLIASAFFVGIMVGEQREADRAVVVTGALTHIPWDERVLAAANGDKSMLVAGAGEEKNFVASDSGKVYYHKTCKGYSRIKEENRVWFASAALAKASGYTPAKNCTIPK